MPQSITRRALLAIGTGACAASGLHLIAPSAFAQTTRSGSPETRPVAPVAPAAIEEMVAKQRQQKGPPLPESLVRDFVFHAHSDPDQVKAILGQEPRIINCAFDWGGGDYETALGAASHMGRRDIALLLLEHKARLDIFAATMLGQLEIVKASLAAFPAALDTPGPHGIPLVRHAQAGGEQASAVLEYLRSIQK